MRWTRVFASCAALIGCADSQSTQQQDGAVAISVDQRGVPRVLQAQALPAAPAATATESARVHVERLAGMWGVAPGTVPELRGVGEVAVPGGKVARIRQEIDGLPVWGRELRVFVKPGGELARASGTLVGTLTPRHAAVFRTDEAGAIARAVERTYGTRDDVHVGDTLARRVWYPTGNELVAAWVVDAYTSRGSSTDAELNRTILAADTGRVLEHRSLTADAAFSYRVFAETTGEKHPFDGPTLDVTPNPLGMPGSAYPDFRAPNLVSVEGLNSMNDAWLTADATETNGNNVDAYVDFNAPNGLSNGDFRANLTAPLTFDRTYNVHAEPMSSQDQQKAGITSLFYGINWLHDFWYDAGFTEAAGNAQKLNYGRGGVEGDAIRAEAQDNALGGSRNNANMSTPDDGMSPTMQVYLWSGSDTRTLTVSGRTPKATAAVFGPKQFDKTGELVLGVDGTAPANNGCEALTNTVTGKIVIVDRGDCSFKTKVLNAQNAGAIAVLIVNNQPAGLSQLGDDNMITTAITIPSFMVDQTEGATIKTEVAANATNARFQRVAGPELDGSLDSTLVAHEFGHYVHHRLSLCGTKMCGAMSEGWGDFLALMLIARDGDDLDGAYPFSVYTTPSFSDDATYYGIRRAPYSVDTTINGLSFRHMRESEPLPAGNIQNLGSNSEVHNAGEVWAAAMWEAYVALQKAGATAGTSFDTTRKKMAEYVVAGLLMAPPDASPLEVRDALLGAALAANRQVDHDTMLAAFARRGFGSCAVAPPPESQDFTEIVESDKVAGAAKVVDYTLTDDCDHDGVLDAGETATLKVQLSNTGHAGLSDVTVAVASTTAGVTVMTPTTNVGSLAQLATADVEVEIKLDSATAPVAGDLTLTVTAAGGCVDTLTVPYALRFNVDDVAEKSATESFDTDLSVWDAAADRWTHVREDALDGAWHGADLGGVSDTALTSPLIEASATDPLTITFQHKYSFEASQSGNTSTYWDGGLIEYSIDDGSTWQDISDLADPGYIGVITNQAGNPLAGKMAFSGQNAAWPAYDMLTLDLGTQLAGKQFRLRFRIGTDQASGDEGWTIDDIAFSGIVGTPFPTQVVDDQSCAAPDPGDGDMDPNDTDDDGGCCDAGPLRGSSTLLALGVLGLVLRRRRRR